MMTKLIQFPDLEPRSTLEWIPIVGLSAVLGGIASAFSSIVGVVLLLPVGLWITTGFIHFVKLSVQRRRWAKQYDRTVSWRRAYAIAQQSPADFVLFVATYGGFDVERIAPLALLEDKKRGMIYAIPTSSTRLHEKCKQLGISVRSETKTEQDTSTPDGAD